MSKSKVVKAWAVSYLGAVDNIWITKNCVCPPPCDHAGQMDIFNTRKDAVRNCGGKPDAVIQVEIRLISRKRGA